jgi:hypothetical protein
MRRIGFSPRALAVALLLTGCGNALLDGTPLGMPNRSSSPDLSRVTAEFRTSGGNAFIRLTAQPTEAALEVLARAGLRPAAGRTHILTYDGLRIATVWGEVAAKAVSQIARLRFVTAIEPSADRISF